MIQILKSQQIENLKECGKILTIALKKVVDETKEGVSTFELDQIAERVIFLNKAEPTFKNYNVSGKRYPSALCVSINDEIVHGLPQKKRFLKRGDIVSLDLGAKYKGMCTDMAVTVSIGDISKEAELLIKITRECLKRGVSEVIIGNNIGSIGHTIQQFAESNNFSVIKDLVGHGIGNNPHQDPQVPNFGSATAGPKIVEGMALAIEPMIAYGGGRIKTLDDNWTISTKDESLSAHFEETVVATKDGPLIITPIRSVDLNNNLCYPK